MILTEEVLDKIYEYCIEQSLTEEQLASLKWYSGIGASRINGYMIGRYNVDSTEEMSHIKAHIKNLRKVIKSFQLPGSLTVYHGTNVKILNNMDISTYLNSDNTIYVKSFLSTSLSEKMAAVFSQQIYGHNNILLQIYLPTGYPALWLNPISCQKAEKELLLLNQTNLSIQSYEDALYNDVPYTKIKVIAR